MPRALAAGLGLAGLLACTGTGRAPAPLPAPVTAPAPARAGVAVIESFTLRAAGLGEDRRINVFLPPGLPPGPVEVLYMPDGGLEEDFPHVTRTVERLIAARAIRPVIVVGIENTERRRDLTGPTEVASDREIAPRVGGSAAFRGFVRDELIPVIEARYPVGGPRTILGESLAGLFIVETFALEPALFQRAIALSPSLWWNRDALVATAPAAIAAAAPAPRTLYLASADEDNIGPQVARVVDALRAAPVPGLTLVHVPRPDLRHDNIYRSLEEAALRAVLAP